MSDQTCINVKILSRLDAISRCLVIDNDTASVHVNTLHAPPRGKQCLKTADSNLKLDSTVKNSDVHLPDLKSIRQVYPTAGRGAHKAAIWSRQKSY